MHRTTAVEGSDILIPRSLDTRVAAIEAALAGPPPPDTSSPSMTAAEGLALTRAQFIGGIRVVALPAPDVIPGLTAPFPGIDVQITDDRGTPQFIRLVPGLKFPPGRIADHVEQAAANLGVTIERITLEEGSR